LQAKLAARLETAVGRAMGFFPIFDANERQLFRKLEQSAFD
jgi:hypothetical protein